MKRIFPFLIAVLFLAGCTPPAEEETAVEYPIHATVASVDGVEISYTVESAGETTLVFVHGWMCDRTYWDAQVPAFRDVYGVVTVDLPGHGSSGTNRVAWSLEAFGEDVKTVVDHLGLASVVVVGHSMGGPVALEAARLMPERVVGVIGIDTLIDADLKWTDEQWNAFLEPLEEDFPGACSGFVRSMFPADPESDLANRISGSMCMPENAETGVALMRLFPDYDVGAALAAAGVPVRCINAPQWPTNIEGNRKYAPDYDAVVMEGVGHFLHMEKPEEFNAHLAAVLEEIGQ
jgi:pimeloyl-ACP methyl ester carboxylesterase